MSSDGAEADGDVQGGLLSSGISPLRTMKLLRVLSNAHKRPISFLRICGQTGRGQRELLAGDEKGLVSRWQCIRLIDLNQEEISQLKQVT